jgi:hypothetical protein
MASLANCNGQALQCFYILPLLKKSAEGHGTAVRDTLHTAGYCAVCVALVVAAPLVAVLMLLLSLYKSIHDLIYTDVHVCW